jgi:hypothetical protein
MKYYVYENWTNTFAKVHRGGCTFCNDGRGFQGRGFEHAERSVARPVLVGRERVGRRATVRRRPREPGGLGRRYVQVLRAGLNVASIGHARPRGGVADTAFAGSEADLPVTRTIVRILPLDAVSWPACQ